jgi:hypothetical protein
MSDWDKDIPVWYTTYLARPVRRFGLFNGEYLVSEFVSFPIACTLVTGPPEWKLHFDGCNKTTKLVLPILSFTRVCKDDPDRIIDTDCIIPTFGPVVDFDKDVRNAAMQASKKAVVIRTIT